MCDSWRYEEGGTIIKELEELDTVINNICTYACRYMYKLAILPTHCVCVLDEAYVVAAAASQEMCAVSPIAPLPPVPP